MKEISGPAIWADLAAADLAELAELAEVLGNQARIRPFFRSLLGLSPMNVDMSVSLVMPETLT